MEHHSPLAFYQQQLKKLQAHLFQLIKRRKTLGWFRFFIFIATVFISYKVFVAAGIAGMGVVAIGMAVLLYLISIDVANNQKISHTNTLISINEEELQIHQNDYYQRFDGTTYISPTHAYANDLDIFGKASLFQWSNRCYTEQGRNLLAANFLQPLPVSQIHRRHTAIKEIAPSVEWRQQLQSFAMQTTVTAATEKKTLNWLQQKEEHYIAPAWKIIVLVYSCVTLLSMLAAILGYIPGAVFSFLYLLYFTISIILSRNTVQAYTHLNGIVKEVETVQRLVQWIEDKNFEAPLLKDLQQGAKIKNEKAALQIKKLKIILDRFDLRLSIVGILFFNSFLLWDVRQMMALNKWRQKNKHLVTKWFEMIAEMEVLNSLATLHFNHPKWCLPNFSDAHFTLHAQELGHPLIPANVRVNNDFHLQGTGKIGLITGSNMAGKSTFLRSLGVNVVLAQMGAPVCAKKMELSPVHLISSMRIADNLAENTSTFYAELKKLKTIIEAVNRQETVFILLDEILRGTNSLDRHTGSEALIAQLIRQKAVAVIATHDIELAALQNHFTQSINNYHFDVQVEGDELYFDYKLKNGVCSSLNASILMKKIGIQLL